MNGEINTAGQHLCASYKKSGEKYEADWDQTFNNRQKLVLWNYNTQKMWEFELLQLQYKLKQ